MDTAEDQSPARTVVRRAVAADIPHMVMIGRKFLDESGYPALGIHGNPSKLHESLSKAIADDAYGVFVADRGGRVIGVAGAVSFTMYFSDAPVAMEMFWWMDPGTRGAAAAIRLIQAMEDWAKGIGCITFSMVDLPGIQSPAPSIYERRGYRMVERTWIKRMN